MRKIHVTLRSKTNMDSISREEFIKYLRDGLNHLYMPSRLRQNPLTQLFGIENHFNVSTKLYDILIEGIESLEPGGESEKSANQTAYHNYEVLFYRYIQQLSQEEIADQLGIGVRHVRRKQLIAFEVLADHLWDKHEVANRVDRGLSQREPEQIDSVVEPSIDDDLAWITESPSEGTADPYEILDTVVEMMRPLASKENASIRLTLSPALPPLTVPTVALRQILLSLLSTIVSAAPNTEILVKTKPLQWDIVIQIVARLSGYNVERYLADASSHFEMVQELIKLSGGKFSQSLVDGRLTVELVFPKLEQIPVLVVDDNADTLQLLQRYTVGSRYRLITTQDPTQVLPLALKHSPQVIVLDVMLPEIDGWEMLGQLKQHGETEQIPVIVCTILNMENLAFSLGASDFVRKPISREHFLSILDKQISSYSSGSSVPE